MQIGCSLRLEQAILHHDKQVEDVERIAATEEGERKREEGERKMVAKEEGERKRSKEQGKSVSTCL